MRGRVQEDNGSHEPSGPSRTDLEEAEAAEGPPFPNGLLRGKEPGVPESRKVLLQRQRRQAARLLVPRVFCTAPGCEKELRSATNRSGHCHKHQWGGLSEAARKQKIARNRQQAAARRTSRPVCLAADCSVLLYRDNISGYCARHRSQSPLVREYKEKYQEINAALLRDVRRQWYAAHREEVKSRVREYNRRHPEIHAAALSRRKARVQVNMGAWDRELSAAYRLAIVNDGCFYCGESPAPTHHVEHYIALAAGGTDHWWNLVRACAPCNYAKHTMSGDEFLLLIRGGGEANV